MMRKGKGKNTTSGKLLPNSWRIVSSCLKTVSTNASTAVRSAVAAAISPSSDDHKDQVSYSGFSFILVLSTYFSFWFVFCVLVFFFLIS